MSLANVAYAPSLTWVDARQRRLEDQMLVPLFGRTPREMNLGGFDDEVAGRLGADPLYSKLFSESFPEEREPVSLRNVQRAIASFERTLLSGDAPYDRLVWKDERDALSPAARRGMALFFSERLACSKCHAGFTFGGPVEWEGGPPAAAALEDNGLGGRFRTPTLRNVAVTAPYMHDGRFETLDAVIDHYASGGLPSPTRSRLVAGFVITGEEKRDLVSFLESLTDTAFLANPLFSDPWKNGR
jgi:cytochrome c peroxidase